MFKEYSLTGSIRRAPRTHSPNHLAALTWTVKIVVLKIRGELSGGKTSDIDFVHLQNLLTIAALSTCISVAAALTSADYASIKVAGEDVTIIEERLFKENVGTVHTNIPELQGDSGRQAFP